jgi:adenylate kinase family enzyme
VGAALRRVVVLGCAGSGKSTVAAELARRTGLPLVPRDEHYWQPGWTAPPDDACRVTQRGLVAEPARVLDGNYASSFDERLPYADTVIVLETPRWRCLVNVVGRALRRRGTEVAPGCPMTVDRGLLRYVWSFPRVHRPRLEAGLATVGPEVIVVHLRTRRQAQQFVAGCSAAPLD